ncbi:serine hydrolase [Aurantibacillus circumpalustris]|uniref:serine hydrolase n=1 Tax=Aurantibacillus circumpalustris TaxID=3036359 RepID=UPI00295B6CB0|nr:serine hydrolase [Aurantibacillus circumpalustris]
MLKKISSSPVKYHTQVIYTQIDSVDGKPNFKNYYFNVNPENYFYCASLVKLPVSILALEKLNEITIPFDAIMFTDSSIACHKKVNSDTSSLNNYPSIENYIKRMLLVSDNESYSRVYEFLGVDYIQKNLHEKGYPEVRIVNRYDGNCFGKNNLISNPIIFLSKDLKVIYRQEELNSSHAPSPLKISMNVGKAYYNEKNKFINKPKSFAGSNYLSLLDCHNMLQELIFNSTKKFKITKDQNEFLIRYLSHYPRQSSSPRYNSKIYYDSYKKYLFYGDSKAIINDTNLIITNIVGQSYGFMSDCAYFLDKKNNISFMLSAVIYANEDEVLNDGKYDYITVALPYLAELGRQFYNYEINRKKISKE